MEIKLTDEERRIKVTDPNTIYPVLKSIIDREFGLQLRREHFWVIGMDYTGLLLYIELAALGNRNRCNVKPNEVFHFAMDKKADSIILAHNHLSGSLEFTPEDLELTDRFIIIGKMMSVEVIDHLILTDDTFTSLRVLGLHEEMSNNPNYPNPVIKHEAELGELRQSLNREFYAMRKKAINRLIQNGTSIESIAESYDLEVFDVARMLDND